MHLQAGIRGYEYNCTVFGFPASCCRLVVGVRPQKTRIRRDGLALVALLLLVFTPIHAQVCAPGGLRVFVTDSQESPVLGADVAIKSDPAPLGQHVTSSEGTADFNRLPCGSWQVSAFKEGFEPAMKTVNIATGSPAEVRLTLNPKAQATSVDVADELPPVEQTASQKTELRPTEVKVLPTNPATVRDTLPLVPGVVRSPEGELKIDGNGEERSAMVVNQSDITDPATGKFGETVPIDAIETVSVLTTPFLAQYGRFTSAVVAVETKRGSDKWHAELNDPFPDFRIRSYHMVGIRDETPRLIVDGPLKHEKLYLTAAFTYFLHKDQNRTLPFPDNVSKKESVNSFTQLDWIIDTRQILTASVHVTPQHTNFINPDYFDPQPVTPSYAQQNYVGAAAYHLGIAGGILDSSVSVQRFAVTVGAQGSADMSLTPVGNRGNYFGEQTREARRQEWLENWSPATVRLGGTHLFRIGSSLTGSSDDGRFSYHPVNISDTAGALLERIDFSAPPSFSRTDQEIAAYAQDHWNLTKSFAFDYGARIEHQRLADNLRIAPRAGFAWTPVTDQRTVLRAGWGQFYDHLPLDVYTFGRYPQRTISYYNPDGALQGPPVEYVNVIGSSNGPRSFLIHGEQVAGAFSPRGAAWNVQAEHSFSRMLRVRADYTDNRSVGLIVFRPGISSEGVHEIVLQGDGTSRYRQFETTAKLAWRDDQQLVFSYTRSRAQGDLNSFDNFLGNFPLPIIQPVVYTNLPGDLPNRFLVWGRMDVHFWKLVAMPLVEYRNGFPYARYDVTQSYVGTPNTDATRFPNFFSADLRLMRDFRINAKYALRLSGSGFNLTNHFNALAIHNNTADPQYGIFFGNYQRRYRFDFDVLF